MSRNASFGTARAACGGLRAALAGALCAALAAPLHGCASSSAVENFVAVPAAERANVLRLTDAVPARLEDGRAAVLPAGSAWVQAGAIPQGDVYRRLDNVYALPGQRQEEAWPVVGSDRLIGFYLPTAKRYAPLSRPAPLRPDRR